MLYCPNFFWNVLQVWMTGKDVYLQITWSWPDKTWNILCSYCLQWNTSQSKFRNHYFLFLFAFSILSQLFLIWGCIILYIIDNILFIISVHSYVVCCFKCTRSLNSGGFWLAVNVFIIYKLEIIILRVIRKISFFSVIIVIVVLKFLFS